ncbi:hypothetical protein [Microbacterium sp.]|uniref:hypothetical protein n=1 Tax=Microbacterium sp. TaxID=51671 RepID=UPI002811EFB6|nr:hypothetical protein [Microbacterium sp.]
MSRDLNTAIAAVFAKSLERQGGTPADLAAAIGISPFRAARLLAGYAPWTLVDAFAAAEYLATDVNEVVRALHGDAAHDEWRTLRRAPEVDDRQRALEDM